MSRVYFYIPASFAQPLCHSLAGFASMPYKFHIFRFLSPLPCTAFPSSAVTPALSGTRQEMEVPHLCLDTDSPINVSAQDSAQSSALDGDDIVGDEDLACCVCGSDIVYPDDAILACDGCDMAVHQTCYGGPWDIPEGDWFCRPCEAGAAKGSVRCAICRQKTPGAFKPVEYKKRASEAAQLPYAHIICALWFGDCDLGENVTGDDGVEYAPREPIRYVEKISIENRKLTCVLCKHKNNGACLQCSAPDCYKAFHPSCARRACPQEVELSEDHSDPLFSFRQILCKGCKQKGRGSNKIKGKSKRTSLSSKRSPASSKTVSTKEAKESSSDEDIRQKKQQKSVPTSERTSTTAKKQHTASIPNNRSLSSYVQTDLPELPPRLRVELKRLLISKRKKQAVAETRERREQLATSLAAQKKARLEKQGGRKRFKTTLDASVSSSDSSLASSAAFSSSSSSITSSASSTSFPAFPSSTVPTTSPKGPHLPPLEPPSPDPVALPLSETSPAAAAAVAEDGDAAFRASSPSDVVVAGGTAGSFSSSSTSTPSAPHSPSIVDSCTGQTEEDRESHDKSSVSAGGLDAKRSKLLTGISKLVGSKVGEEVESLLFLQEHGVTHEYTRKGRQMLQALGTNQELVNKVRNRILSAHDLIQMDSEQIAPKALQEKRQKYREEALQQTAKNVELSPVRSAFVPKEFDIDQAEQWRE